VKIYVAAVEALRKKERQDETQVTTKKCWFSEIHPGLPPTLNANVLLTGLFLISPRFWTKLRLLVLCFHDFTMENSFV
jgi:hypothetical protein